jgi:hypothetical protein
MTNRERPQNVHTRRGYLLTISLMLPKILGSGLFPNRYTAFFWTCNQLVPGSIPGAGTIQNKAPAEMQGLCCFCPLKNTTGTRP